MDRGQFLSTPRLAGLQSPSKCGHAMTAAHTIDRRSCLRVLIGLLGVLSLGPGRDSLPTAKLDSWLKRIDPARLGDRVALSRLGAIYLASHPEEQGSERLSRLLLRDSADPVEIGLIESIARDWLKHDVTQVEGWVLSRTEARICAAVHLMAVDRGD